MARRNRPPLRPFGAAGAAIALCVAANWAHAIVLYSDGTNDLAYPSGAISTPTQIASDLVGSWGNNASVVPIAPNFGNKPIVVPNDPDAIAALL